MPTRFLRITTVPSPAAGNIKTGEYGFEDVINLGSPTGNPNGILEVGKMRMATVNWILMPQTFSAWDSASCNPAVCRTLPLTA
jgi:hypothetical protein